jgi:DNA-binding Xre family transcriptional regulator
MAGMIKVQIAEVAQRRGITTAYQLQKALNIPPAMAAKLWKGDFKMIGLETIDRLCKALKCKPHQFLVFESEQEES